MLSQFAYLSNNVGLNQNLKCIINILIAITKYINKSFGELATAENII